MIIAFIDGLGGGLMGQLIDRLPANIKEKHEIMALGTNALATVAMVKAGAKTGASGEGGPQLVVERRHGRPRQLHVLAQLPRDK